MGCNFQTNFSKFWRPVRWECCLLVANVNHSSVDYLLRERWLSLCCAIFAQRLLLFIGILNIRMRNSASGSSLGSSGSVTERESSPCQRVCGLQFTAGCRVTSHVYTQPLYMQCCEPEMSVIHSFSRLWISFAHRSIRRLPTRSCCVIIATCEKTEKCRRLKRWIHWRTRCSRCAMNWRNTAISTRRCVNSISAN